MKRISFIALAFACCMSLTMCQKDSAVKDGDNGQVTIGIRLDDTKVSLTQEDKKLSLAWEEDDCIRVVGQTSEVYAIQPGFAPTYAAFTGNSTGSGNKTVLYPGTYASADALGARSYTAQEQDGNASTAHLEFNAVASDLTDIEEVDFTSDNAKAKINQAVKFVVKLPAGVTKVSSLILQAPSQLFYTTNAGEEKTDKLVLSLKNVDVSASEQVLTAYMMMSWQPMAIAAGTALTVKVLTPTSTEACCHSLTATTNSAITWVGGNTYVLDMSSKSLVHSLKGKGTQAEPYLIYDAMDLEMMKDLVASKSMTYFKQMADIDMKNVTSWNPVNQTEPYDIGVTYDGDNHTISNFTFNTSAVYAGFIGVLNGKVSNLTFDNASVTGTKAAGVVCGFAGTGSYKGDIENVTITNSSVSQKGVAHTGLVFGTNGIAGTYKNISAQGNVSMSGSVSGSGISSKMSSGGIAGSSCASTYINCSFTGTIDGNRIVGGIVGYERTAGSTFSKCSVDATLTAKKTSGGNSENGGGIVGFLQGGTVSDCCAKGTLSVYDQIGGGIVGTIKEISTVTNCYSAFNISDNRNFGGIVARATQEKWDYSIGKCLEISGCIYWGTKIDCGKAGTGNGSSGSIVGFTSINNVMKDCWRINDSKFTFVNTGNTANTPVDQPNCVPGTSEAWAVGTTPQIGSTTYCYPYWGKQAAADATASSVAKTLGWDESIWDLSSDEPKLK